MTTQSGFARSGFGARLAMLGVAALCASAASAAPPEIVAVAGATGRTGTLVVEQLLAAHRPVRALVRDVAKAEATLGKGVEFKVADVRDLKSLTEALRGVTYVISTIGASGGLKSAPGDGPQEVDFQGVRNLALAAKAAGVRQFVLVSSTGTGHADTYPSAFMRPFLQAKAQGEAALRGSGVPYTIVRPGGLTNEAPGASLAFAQGDTESGRISRADVALVCIAALGDKSAFGKTFEVFDGDAGPTTDWKARFAALRLDAPASPDP
jgi:uncharacterized protein YbjT (DUF2867 family)